MSTKTTSSTRTRQPWPPRFIFISGRLCLDFAHTGGKDGVRAHFERLHQPTDLADWLAASPLALAGVPVTQADLEQALELREAIWHAALQVWQGEPIALEHLAVLNRAAQAADLAPQLSPAGEKTTQQRYWLPTQAASAALATIARDAIDLFAGELRQRIRQCENPTCALMFVDTSRPGNRRWCTMKRCGNLIKTARYRHSHAQVDDETDGRKS